uniref:Major sperm protein n=1 Tax=Ascaris lumbricoides TaxID=6252 RepID=A0A0M3HN67_ASCLU
MKGTSQRRMLRDALVLIIVIISAYLLHGRYAQAVCNLCTALPACIFSYVQLSDRSTQLFAFKATIFYWIISGVLIASDNVFVDSFGYFFGKFLLLTTLFFNAVQQHRIGRRIIERQQYGAHTTASKASLLTAITLTDATQNSILAPYKVKRVIPTCSISTALSNNVRSPEMTAFSDPVYTDTASLYSLEVTTASGEGALDTRSSNEMHKAGDRASLVKRSLAEPTVITVDVDGNVRMEPNKSVTLRAPFVDPATVNIINNNNSGIIWALRTNAVERLVAQPTSGVVPGGGSVEFKVGLVEAPPADESVSDRLGIDYGFVDSSVTTFDRDVFQAAYKDRKRLKVDVHYEQ